MSICLLRSLSVVAAVAALAAPRGAVEAQTRGPIAVGDVTPLIPPTLHVADSLFFAMDPRSALTRLEIRLEVAPDDFEARWRAARASLVLGTMSDDHTKGALLRRASDHASRALALRPGNVEAMAWTAAAKGRLAIDDAGVRDQIRLGKEVWELTTKLLEIDPDHALGNDVLGKLHQEVRRLSGFQRFMARTFLGGGNPMGQSSWARSEEHLMRAIAADPTVVLFYLDLGETYQAQGKDREAREVFLAGLRRPDIYPPDPKFKGVMRRRLIELGPG